MCWNSDISINTFIFSCLTLLFIFITNTYTKYKTPLFNNKLAYLLIFVVVSIQLIEFFLWRNIKNKKINNYLSIIGMAIIYAQILILILMIPDLNNRYLLLTIFIITSIIYFFTYTIKNYSKIYTDIGKNGHLDWNWSKYNGYENIWIFIWLLFYIIPCFLIKDFILSFFILATLVFSLFFYLKSNTFGTMWCWSFNIISIYFILNILMIQPFLEYNALC